MWLYETVILLCAGSSLTLAAIIWSKRPVQGAAPLAALFLVMGWSSLCYSMDLGSTNLDFSVFWNRAGLLSDVFVTPLMLILALTITGEKKPRPRSIALFVLLTFCVPMLSWTNDWHHLYFTKVWIDSSGPMPVLAKARGPFFSHPVRVYVSLHIYSDGGRHPRAVQGSAERTASTLSSAYRISAPAAVRPALRLSLASAKLSAH